MNYFPGQGSKDESCIPALPGLNNASSSGIKSIKKVYNPSAQNE